MPNEMLSVLFGLAGAALTAAIATPQAVRALRVGTAGVSSTTFQLLFAVALTWTIYGVLQELWFLAAGNAVLVASGLVVLWSLQRESPDLWHNTRVILAALISMAAAAAVESTWLGWIAGLLSVLLRFPQLQLVRSSEDIKGVSLPTWVVAALASALWFGYGFVNNDLRLTVVTFINVLTTGSLIVAVRARRRVSAY